MQKIPSTHDHEDSVGARCNLQADGATIHCARRYGHRHDTATIFKNPDTDEETVVMFNHRGLVGGSYYAW